MTIDFARSDLADALLDVPPRLADVFKEYVQAVPFQPDVHAPGSEHAQTVIQGALRKVREAQGMTPAKDTRTDNQKLVDAVKARFDVSAYSDDIGNGRFRTSAIKMQKLCDAMRARYSRKARATPCDTATRLGMSSSARPRKTRINQGTPCATLSRRTNRWAQRGQAVF